MSAVDVLRPFLDKRSGADEACDTGSRLRTEDVGSKVVAGDLAFDSVLNGDAHVGRHLPAGDPSCDMALSFSNEVREGALRTCLTNCSLKRIDHAGQCSHIVVDQATTNVILSSSTLDT